MRRRWNTCSRVVIFHARRKRIAGDRNYCSAILTRTGRYTGVTFPSQFTVAVFTKRPPSITIGAADSDFGQSASTQQKATGTIARPANLSHLATCAAHVCAIIRGHGWTHDRQGFRRRKCEERRTCLAARKPSVGHKARPRIVFGATVAILGGLGVDHRICFVW